MDLVPPFNSRGHVTMLLSHRLPCKRPVKLKCPSKIFITFLCDLIYFISENLFKFCSASNKKTQKNRQTWVSQTDCSFLFIRTEPQGGLRRGLSCLLTLLKKCALNIISICEDLNCRESELNCPMSSLLCCSWSQFVFFWASLGSLACWSLPQLLLEVQCE